MGVPGDPTIFFLHYQYSWFSPVSSRNYHKLQCSQKNRVCLSVETYQTLWFGKIYNPFAFLPKKGNWCSTHKHVVRNTSLSLQYESPFRGFPFLHVRVIRKLNCFSQLPVILL